MRVGTKAGVVAVIALVLALVAAAQAAAPSPSQLTLQAADLPGARITSQSAVKDGHYAAAYERSFAYAVPSGRSGLVYVRAQSMVAASDVQAGADLALIRRALASKTARATFVSVIARDLKVKATDVTTGKLRTPKVGDRAVELPFATKLRTVRIYESLLYMQLDRVLTMIAVAGVHPIVAADTSRLAAIAGSHVVAALTPAVVTAPSISGTPQQGQTLTAAAGTWNVDGLTYAFQWQRCDATGANCVDIAGATTGTYVLAATDAGSTFRVNVTAANRFGTVTAASAVTAVVT